MTRLADLEPGDRLGDYEIVGVLGRGGMGRVYKAYHPRLRRFAAIKVVGSAADAEAVRRFEREAQAVAALRHPHTLAVYDYGEVEGEPYMVLEFMEGGSPAARQFPLPAAEVIRVLQPVALALDHAHAHGIVHRDVKPANIFLDREGRPVLGDFGLSKVAPFDSLTNPGTVTGTPSFASPEQARGLSLGPATDIYSLAVTAFLLLTGRLPFPAGDDALVVLYQHVNESPPAPSEVRQGLPPAVDAVLLRGLAKEPRERWPSATAMIDALAAALGVERRHAPPRRRAAPARALAAAVAVIAILVLAGAAYTVTRPRAGARVAPPAAAKAGTLAVDGADSLRLGGPVHVVGHGLRPQAATVFVVDDTDTAAPIKDPSLVSVRADGTFDEAGQVNPGLAPGKGLVEACNLDSAGRPVDSTCVKAAVVLVR